MLIENGADINTPSEDVRKSSIVILVLFSIIGRLRLITRTDSHSNGCIIISFSLFLQQGDTPLMLATMKGTLDIVQQLLAHSADSSAKNKVNIRRSR